MTAAPKKYTAVPIHGGTARIEQILLQGKDNRASALSYCIDENHTADLCSARVLSYELHVCVVFQGAEGINKQRSQISCNCGHYPRKQQQATTCNWSGLLQKGKLVYLVTTDCEQTSQSKTVQR